MPTIYIDNQAHEVNAGKQNLLHALLTLGLDVPYFCWHPALGSVGACRQCAVQHFKDEEDTHGRMVMSCMTPVSDKMRVSVEHATCKTFRSEVIEWMMTNHPHDCPICDEGGECHLQDMTVMTGHNYRRFRFKKRTFKNQNLGPFVNHEMNRCITCYRCVRFYRDVAGGNDLGAFSSSNNVYFGRFEEGTLDSEFSGNLVEVCPTGVFTDKPFKEFFNRKWDLQMAPSVCQLCSLGCNIIPGERFQSVRRVSNKFHHEINDYFLCDRGRFGHSFVNSENRLLKPKIRDKDKKSQVEVESEVGLSTASHLFSPNKKIAGIGSPRASLESNFALRCLVGEENFFDGLSEKDSVLTRKVCEVLEKGAAESASLKDVKEADAVIVLGEDLINTAPRLALALRQNAIARAQKQAGEQKIPEWHDLAVRNLVKEKCDSIFVLSATESKLEDIAHVSNYTPDETARIGFDIASKFTDKVNAPAGLTVEQRKVVDKIVEVLKKSEKPVLISGTSLSYEPLIESVANIAWAMCEAKKKAKLCYVVPEANSVGLSVLNPKPLSDLVNKPGPSDYQTAIILENDLSRRLPEPAFTSFFKSFSHTVAIDSFENKTTKACDVALCCAPFTESTGTLVNNEGRIQRFYSVFERKEKILESWRILNQIQKTNSLSSIVWNKIDDITDAMGSEVELLKNFDEQIFKANFTIDGQKIPRETIGFSGRTAIYADRTMHEPAPSKDQDSPLSYSMEGFDGQVPSTLTPFFWAPGWNSVQSVNKFQNEVGGALNSFVPVIKVFESKKDKSLPYFKEPPVVLEANDKHIMLFPKHYIFGSEERSPMSLALSKRLSKPCVLLNKSDAKQRKIAENTKLFCKENASKVSYEVVLSDSVPKGAAFISVGSSDTEFVSLPRLVDMADFFEEDS